jgi:hypothetical protein
MASTLFMPGILLHPLRGSGLTPQALTFTLLKYRLQGIFQGMGKGTASNMFPRLVFELMGPRDLPASAS